MEAKKLRRSLKDTVIGGVSGGLGTYFGADPVIFRILFVVLAITGGGGVIIYLLMWIFIPKEELDFKESQNSQQNFNSSDTESGDNNKGGTEEKQKDTVNENMNTKEPKEIDPKILQRRKNGNLIGGAFLIMIGLFFLADDFFPWLSWQYLWPAALILAGLAIIKLNYKPKND
jgi:phage shock protein C